MDFNLNQPIVFGDPLHIRRIQLDELDTLVRIIAQLHHRAGVNSPTTIDPAITSRIEDGIHTVLNALFPDQEIEQDLAWYIANGKVDPIKESFGADNVQTYPEDRNVHADVEEAYTPLKKSLSWVEAAGHLLRTPGSMIAREGWDNKINQEYVTYQTGALHAKNASMGGYVKYYLSIQSDNYKKVEHTYHGNDEDKEATDWYII